jgi:hypothetical protein
MRSVEAVSPKHVTKPDSCPASPIEISESPTSLRRKGVCLGFSVSVLLKNLVEIVADNERRSKQYFIRRIAQRRARMQSLSLMEDLISRKVLNRKFKAFSELLFDDKKREPREPAANSTQRTILPLNTSHPSARVVNLVRGIEMPHLRIFAGLGRSVGIILSVHRSNKQSVFDVLKSHPRRSSRIK